MELQRKEPEDDQYRTFSELQIIDNNQPSNNIKHIQARILLDEVRYGPLLRANRWDRLLEKASAKSSFSNTLPQHQQKTHNNPGE